MDEHKEYEPGLMPAASEPVAAEEVAEAQEDAGEAADLKGLERLHAIALLENPTMSTIMNATIAGDNALLKIAKLKEWT